MCLIVSITSRADDEKWALHRIQVVWSNLLRWTVHNHTRNTPRSSVFSHRWPCTHRGEFSSWLSALSLSLKPRSSVFSHRWPCTHRGEFSSWLSALSLSLKPRSSVFSHRWPCTHRGEFSSWFGALSLSQTSLFCIQPPLALYTSRWIQLLIRCSLSLSQTSLFCIQPPLALYTSRWIQLLIRCSLSLSNLALLYSATAGLVHIEVNSALDSVLSLSLSNLALLYSATAGLVHVEVNSALDSVLSLSLSKPRSSVFSHRWPCTHRGEFSSWFGALSLSLSKPRSSVFSHRWPCTHRGEFSSWFGALSLSLKPRSSVFSHRWPCTHRGEFSSWFGALSLSLKPRSSVFSHRWPCTHRGEFSSWLSALSLQTSLFCIQPPLALYTSRWIQLLIRCSLSLSLSNLALLYSATAGLVHIEVNSALDSVLSLSLSQTSLFCIQPPLALYTSRWIQLLIECSLSPNLALLYSATAGLVHVEVNSALDSVLSLSKPRSSVFSHRWPCTHRGEFSSWFGALSLSQTSLFCIQPPLALYTSRWIQLLIECSLSLSNLALLYSATAGLVHIEVNSALDWVLSLSKPRSSVFSHRWPCTHRGEFSSWLSALSLSNLTAAAITFSSLAP